MTELSWKKKAIDKATGGLYDKKSKKIIRYAKKKAKKPSNKGFLCFLDARGGNIMKKSAKKRLLKIYTTYFVKPKFILRVNTAFSSGNRVKSRTIKA